MTVGEHRDADQSRRKGAPWPLILILGCIIIPIVAAYIAYYTGLGVSEETVNEGVLLQPPARVESLANQASDQVPDMQDHKWHILIPLTAPCEDACGQNLYTTRQVHIRLGEKSQRVERVAVNLAGDEGKAMLEELEAEHPLLEHFSVPAEAWDQWLRETNAPDREQTHYYLLVDQQGYAMMYYTADHHGNQLLDDLKRILRYTPE